MNADGRSYVTGYFDLQLDGLDEGGASGDRFVFEPRESREPPGELPVIILDSPADDEARRLECDGGTSGDCFVFAPQESREPPGELPTIIVDDPGDDEARRLDSAGATGDGNGAWPKDGSDFFLT